MGSYLPQGVRALHVDKHLSNVVQNLVGEEQFIAAKIAPIIRVQKQTDMIMSWPQDDWYRQDNDKRSPGTQANEVAFDVTSLTYYAQNYALKASVPVEDMANADPMLVKTLREGRARFLGRKLAINWEIRLSNLIFSSTGVGTSTTVASAFTDKANSDPIAVIQQRMDQIEDTIGFRPNNVLFGNDSWRYTSRNNTVIDKANKTGVTGAAKNASTEQVKALLEVDNVLIGKQKYNQSEEGITKSLGDVWGDSILCYYAPMAASIEEPSYMYSFRWVVPGVPDMRVENLPYDPFKKTNQIEMGYYQDERVLTKELAGLITNVTSSASGGLTGS